MSDETFTWARQLAKFRQQRKAHRLPYRTNAKSAGAVERTLVRLAAREIGNEGKR